MSDMWASFFLMKLEASLFLVTFSGSMGNSSGQRLMPLYNLPGSYKVGEMSTTETVPGFLVFLVT